jgi:uncharacterized protein YdeI (YjbR/CyaY-like superfamily)
MRLSVQMAKLSPKNPAVDWYFSKHERWAKEINRLRTIVLTCGLTEELKWGCPCYQFGSSNVVLIHVFKQYCALLFFKGALLKDDQHILVQQTKNVQAARQMRFTQLSEIVALESAITDYIKEAILVEQSGLKVVLKPTAQFDMPEEFAVKLKELPAVKEAFYALTPGRQRAYLLYFSGAKQSKTRQVRIDKCLDSILSGKGLDD